jgi:hypothetical protein
MMTQEQTDTIVSLLQRQTELLEKIVEQFSKRTEATARHKSAQEKEIEDIAKALK